MHEALRIRLVRLIEVCIPRNCRDGEEREELVFLQYIGACVSACMWYRRTILGGRKEWVKKREWLGIEKFSECRSIRENRPRQVPPFLPLVFLSRKIRRFICIHAFLPPSFLSTGGTAKILPSLTKQNVFRESISLSLRRTLVFASKGSNLLFFWRLPKKGMGDQSVLSPSL